MTCAVTSSSERLVTSLHLASLGEAWWLMPKVGEAGQTGDARQLLLLMGDEGIWIQLQNYGTLNMKLKKIDSPGQLLCNQFSNTVLLLATFIME